MSPAAGASSFSQLSSDTKAQFLQLSPTMTITQSDSKIHFFSSSICVNYQSKLDGDNKPDLIKILLRQLWGILDFNLFLIP